MSIEEKIEYLDSQILYLKAEANSKWPTLTSTEINKIISYRNNLKKERLILIKQKERMEKIIKINKNENLF